MEKIAIEEFFVKIIFDSYRLLISACKFCIVEFA